MIVIFGKIVLMKVKNNMKILRKKKKEEKKLLGAYFPLAIFQYFNLLSVIKGRSKSKLIREIITEWYNEQLITEKELIDNLINIIQNQWIIRKKNLKSENDLIEDYKKFKYYLKIELQGRGIEADKIIESIEL